MSKKSTRDHSVKPGKAPFTGADAIEPHYGDTLPAGMEKPVTGHTSPNALPMAAGSKKLPDNTNDKLDDMDAFRADGEGQGMTTTLGVKVANNQNTLRAGERGPALMEDFHYLDKLGHFDRERIPERVVHARGSGAHGYFQVYKSLAKYTKAAFLQDPDIKTPVFVRFSNVQGFRGSPDTVRDIRGFATKFYTMEGNFDLVGNDTPVFFVQDPVKFPDYIHAVKPEPHNEVPQGQSAHDSYWDFVSLQPESLHNVMWAMSDRGIPRSYRMIEGFGIHTFRLVNAEGKSCFVRFHWKPVYGKSSLLWDEANELMGRDPDYHRKDLWQGIEAGDYPEFELGLQIIPEEDEHKFDFDILDATKLIPEALVPVEIVGKMVLNRNPDNFFAETEQVAFCPANIVPGIDFSEDPLLIGRVFSYRDTQLYRLGGPNYNELPINRPLCPVRNHQREGFNRLQIDRSEANYEPNSIGNNWPRETPDKPVMGGFESVKTKIEGEKIRKASPGFANYYSQPRLFWLSQTPNEQLHIINAFSFELSKVMRPYIRERVVDLLTRIDPELAGGVAMNLGIELTKEQLSRELPDPVNGITSDPTLSLYKVNPGKLKSRRVSLLLADGVSGKSVKDICDALEREGIHPQMIAAHMGTVSTDEGDAIMVEATFEGCPSVLVDAVLVPDGPESIQTLMQEGKAKFHLRQAYKHLKPIGLLGAARDMLNAAGLPDDDTDAGLLTGDSGKAVLSAFLDAMKQNRVWDREPKISSVEA